MTTNRRKRRRHKERRGLAHIRSRSLRFHARTYPDSEQQGHIRSSSATTTNSVGPLQGIIKEAIMRHLQGKRCYSDHSVIGVRNTLLLQGNLDGRVVDNIPGTESGAPDRIGTMGHTLRSVAFGSSHTLWSGSDSQGLKHHTTSGLPAGFKCSFHGPQSCKSGRGFVIARNRKLEVSFNMGTILGYLECTSCRARVCSICVKAILNKAKKLASKIFVEQDKWCSMAKHLISLLTDGRMTVFHVPPDISNCCEFKRERKELEKLEKLNKVSAQAISHR